jgi:hypothetical protein
MKRLAYASIAFCLSLTPPALAADIPVDLELVFAVDVSGSVDWEEAALQRRGYIEALRSEEVVNAIRSGAHGKIAVAYVEWAGTYLQRTVIDWTVLDGADSVGSFTDTLSRASIESGPWTSISAAIQYVVPMFARNDYQGTRRVIDVSGDGPNNQGIPIIEARAQALAAGITINGLPIVNDRQGPGSTRNIKDLDRYYRDCVIGGTGAFMIVANNFKDFATAIKRKLIFEIAGLFPPSTDGNVVPVQGEDAGYCLIGERQFRGGGGGLY